MKERYSFSPQTRNSFTRQVGIAQQNYVSLVCIDRKAQQHGYIVDVVFITYSKGSMHNIMCK